MRSCLVVCALAASSMVSRAQTFVVDASNGPGTNFTDIPPAVAAAPNGAVIEVRAGSYSAFTIANKGVSMLFDNGASVLAATVTGTSTTQVVELDRMVVSGGAAGVALATCQGPVHLRECVIRPLLAVPLQIVSCGAVHCDACSFYQLSRRGVVIDTSTAVFVDCDAISGDLSSAIDLHSSSVQFIDCFVSLASFSAGVALQTTNSSVRVVGGRFSSMFGNGIVGTGTARVDPSASCSWYPATLGVAREMPAVVATSTGLGGVVSASLRGPASDSGLLAFGFLATPFVIAAGLDESWLVPGTETVCAFTPLLGAANLGVTYALPVVPAARGARLCWQGASFGPVNGLQVANPAITTLW